jgi:hypothetical protein
VAVGDIAPVPGGQFEETLAWASPDILREMVRGFAQRMMDADVEVRCNAGYGVWGAKSLPVLRAAAMRQGPRVGHDDRLCPFACFT